MVDTAGSITKIASPLHSRPRTRHSGANPKSSVDEESSDNESHNDAVRTAALSFEQFNDVVQQLNNQSELTHVILYIVTDCKSKNMEAAVYHYETLVFLGQLPDREVIKIADSVTVQGDITNAFTGKLISDFV